ncbi:hypothetical protein NC653_001854 [Populus alba x Populus x berolinensis]|uniref:Uncharacterized protein n=1 Tax=Populus alba x Populus x berolinensis TaxID=444605 RepID=A0AAD6RM94_9ROSI|nr:hypothetical protein NC653_001854 [Populus alba x Populus x berolinensis]
MGLSVKLKKASPSSSESVSDGFRSTKAKRMRRKSVPNSDMQARDYVSRKKEALSIWCLYRKAKQIIKKMFKIFLKLELLDKQTQSLHYIKVS